MPIAHFHLPAGVATPEQERGLLLDAGEAYSRILESPIERVRVFVVEYDATRVAVGGEIVADGGSVAPYFTAIVLAGRPAGQRRELLATFTDLIVTWLDVERTLVRGRIIEVAPDNWAIGGSPASAVRAAEITGLPVRPR